MTFTLAAKEWWTKFQFGADARKNMYQSFLDYLQQGVAINDIVTDLAISIKKAKARRFMYQVTILEDISLQMSSGIEFSEALSRWVPANEAMSVRAGMESGDPVSGMQNTIDAVGAATEMKSVIVNKLSYPVVLVFALIGLIYFFSLKIIPRIAEVIDPSLWPENSKSMYSTAIFVQDKGIFVGLVFAALAVLVGWSLPRTTGTVRKYLDKFPPYSFYKAFHSANLLISLAALMRSGVPFVDAMGKLSKYSDAYLQDHLDRMIVNIADGLSLSESMDTGLLSQEMMVSVHMMSNNANFQQAINEIGRQSVKRGIERISVISSLINAGAMFGITAYVGWIYMCFNAVANAMGQAANI
ncbi:type II secretion system F family protein [Pseudomonas taiwanensis]|uniref:type II secretion system F family protein n=1 Tax=Pseudomonas taiwanensis TaxID=470150 RepID=UPI0028DFDBC5|nr:type II secretion system F family protein [Pseudomonas taiwanensis]MDT8925002.1 type II secretion system F family protein [Pseudomonas taiwanensis]